MNFKEKITRKTYNIIGKLLNSLAQNQGVGDKSDKSVTQGMPELLREIAAEGAVLLKNNGVLPFKPNEKIAVFGRTQIETFFVGYGSGGDVNEPYKVNYLDGLLNCEGLKIDRCLAEHYRNWCSANPVDEGFWGRWPRYFPEMPLDASEIEAAAKRNDKAVVFIGRSSGEDRENTAEKGSFYLTDEEMALIKNVTEFFDDVVVVLNIGSVIDFSWLNDFDSRISAVLVAWQGGMESGNALADLLSGKVTPSGKLTDTLAVNYSDYPSSADFGAKKYNNYTEDIFVGYRYFSTFASEKVMFPFGFGLSYADFEINCILAQCCEGKLRFKFKVTNTSPDYCGKEVVQLYYSAPQGKLVKPAVVLADFAKTKLLAPNSSQELEFELDCADLASFDDSGVTGYKNAYVLEKGIYSFFFGNSSVDLTPCFELEVPETYPVKQLTEVCAPKLPFKRIGGIDYVAQKAVPRFEAVPTVATNLKDIIKSTLPVAVSRAQECEYKLSDVKSGKITLDEFVAQLNLTELEAISRGDYKMDSPLGAKGNAGALGGVTESLREKGVEPIITTDGPSGIRLYSSCSLLPIGTLLACSWNEDLTELLYANVGREMKAKGSDVLLAPGMNIHRNPLCGRNFEYFSEDPLLSGRIASAVVNGVQSVGLSACPKHFACNSQETNRCYNDSRLSQRALREIYLKGFEICVKSSKPKCIMTSYNKINGVWGHYNYELCTTVLRKEWGYKGCVITDWWMRKSKSPEFPSLRDNAYRVRAQVDVLMPGGNRSGKRKPDGTLLETYGKPDGITLGELQRTAKNVLTLALSIDK